MSPSDPIPVEAQPRDRLLAEFEELYRLAKPLDREMALLQKAKAFAADSDISVNEYRHLFEVYVADARTPDAVEWLLNFTSRINPIVKIFQTLASLAIIVSAFQLATSFAEQRSQRITERWQTISSGLNAGGAKRKALEYLHDQGELLSNVELSNVALSRLNLPERLPSGDEQRYLTPVQKKKLRGARLQEADFRGSNLYQGYLQGANLYRSNFSSLDNSQTNLDGVNFQNTDLRQADFRGASVRNACFKGANLEKADFTGAELRNTDFRGSRLLTKSQVQSAGVGVDSSLFDAPLSQELGLGDLSDKSEPASCRIEPRKVSWWRTLMGR